MKERDDGDEGQAAGSNEKSGKNKVGKKKDGTGKSSKGKHDDEPPNKKQKSDNVASRFISDWPEQIQVLVDQDAVPNTVADNNCGSYTVVFKNGGKVQINKRKHFYILTKKERHRGQANGKLDQNGWHRDSMEGSSEDSQAMNVWSI